MRREALRRSDEATASRREATELRQQLAALWAQNAAVAQLMAQNLWIDRDEKVDDRLTRVLEDGAIRGMGAVSEVRFGQWRNSGVMLRRWRNYRLRKDDRLSLLTAVQKWANLRHPNVLTVLAQLAQ